MSGLEIYIPGGIGGKAYAGLPDTRRVAIGRKTEDRGLAEIRGVVGEYPAVIWLRVLM